jgi:SAM-dependent methyltransferase
MKHEYRVRLYEKYGSTFQDAGQHPRTVELKKFAKAYDYYLRRWLPVDRNAEILDAGCGNGKLLHYFLAKGYIHSRGVDISPEQIELAQQLSLDVCLQDAVAYLEDKSDSYDLITALDLIEHFDKNEAMRFLDLSFKALKPQGALVLQTPNADSPFGISHRYNDLSHEICFNPHSLCGLLNLAGFMKNEVREMGPILWRYSPASTVRYFGWQFIRTLINISTLIETGGSGSNIFTRIFLIRAIKNIT